MGHNHKDSAIWKHICISVCVGAASAGVLWLSAGSACKESLARIDASVQKGNPQYTYGFEYQEATSEQARKTGRSGGKKDGDKTKQARKTGRSGGNEDGDKTKQATEITKPRLEERYGWISSEDIDLGSYLYYGDTEEVLEKGIGQYTGSSLPGAGGTLLACGHDTTFCEGLKEASPGDRIQIQTAYGIYNYEVSKTAVVPAEDVEACKLDSKKEQLILYTCWPFGKRAKKSGERYFVYCKKVNDKAS